MTTSAAAVDSCHMHSSLPLAASDQVQEYSESEVETDGAALELENDVAALKLETDATDLELKTDAATLKLETDTTALKLEIDTTALDLDMETDVSQEIPKVERYSTEVHLH
jgi:hypothetical protein